MESSKIFGGSAEEYCESSESGWTMYIGSPTGDYDGDNDKRENGEGITHDDAHNPEDESDDDSMASDASSRPIHYGVVNGSAAEEEYDGIMNCCLDKKGSETQEKKMEGEKVEEKEMLFTNGKGKSLVQGDGKVRKNYWVGKRK